MSVGKTTRKGLSFVNVVAAGVATAMITAGKTLLNYQLKLGGTSFTKAMISLIEIKANAKTILIGSGAQIDAMNAYRGIPTSANFLDVSFEDLTGLDIADRVVGCLDTTIGVANLTAEVTIAGATAPTLEAKLYECAPQRAQNGSPSPLAGLMAKTLRYPFQVASGGELPLNFPFGPKSGAIIKRVHVFHGGQMTGAVVKENAVEIHRTLLAENNYELARHGRVPQTNVYHIDFVPDGDMRKAFDTTKSESVEWLFTFAAADNGFVLIEYIDHLGNL